MRNLCVVCAIVLSGLFMVASPALAIVAPPNTPANFVGEWTGNNPNWSMSSVPCYSFNNLSCEAIAPNAVIMAAHCDPHVGNGIIMDGNSYTFTKVIQPPDGGDLALCILDHPTNNYVLPYGGALNTGAHVVMMGYGNYGTTYPDCFVPDQINRNKRWGTNTIDYTGSWLTMLYHAGDTDYEAGFGVGDSGGGTYIKNSSGFWRQVGVNVAIGGGGSQPGGYSSSYSVSLPYYYQWLVSNITIPGDSNLDGKVNFMDYISLEVGYGKSATDGVESGDFNFDGKVSFADYLILEANLGKSSPSAVPEPATLALLAVGALMIRRGRRAQS